MVIYADKLHYYEAREILHKIEEIGATDPDLAMGHLDWIEQIYQGHGLDVRPIARAREALGELDAALGSIFADCEVVGAPGIADSEAPGRPAGHLTGARW